MLLQHRGELVVGAQELEVVHDEKDLGGGVPDQPEQVGGHGVLPQDAQDPRPPLQAAQRGAPGGHRHHLRPGVQGREGPHVQGRRTP